MAEICEEIWNKFGGKDENPLEVESSQDVMRRAEFQSRKKAMTKILRTLEPSWFLEALRLEAYVLDEEGNIVNGEVANQEAAGSAHKEEEGDDLGDVAVSDDESIFGSYGDKTAWKTKINKRLPVDLHREIKAFFADGSEQFIKYHLSDGCFNENFQYAHSLLISDTAVFHVKQFYEL
jgi:hypothetical protein